MTGLLRALVLWRLRARSTALEDDDLRRRTVVFAPHYDDEVLGVGGTILRMVEAGASPTVVFMTDGGKSHRHLMPETELAAVRAREALEANRFAGLREGDVVRLEYEDGHLTEHVDAGVRDVVGILAERSPERIFVPYRLESPPDHSATRAIVRRALREAPGAVEILEYPVWFWYHWPAVPLQLPSRSDLFRELGRGLGSVRHLLAEFDRRVEIGERVERKRAYLNRYASQMTRLVPDERWKTLGDVADGAFLRCFFEQYEYFHRAMFPGTPGRDDGDDER